MRKFIYLLIFLGFALPLSVFAEPLPWGIAINEKTQECAAFWGGDEFTENILPNGWKDYYPVAGENNRIIIKTENGTCEFVRGKEKECCQQLGLPYVEDINIKSQQTDWAKQNKNNIKQNVPDARKQYPEKFYNNESLFIGGAVIILTVMLVLLLRKKKT